MQPSYLRSFSSRRCSTWVLPLALSLLTPASASCGDPHTDQLVALVIDAIRRNDSQIHSAHLRLLETREDRQPLELNTGEESGDETIRIFQQPKMEWAVDVTLRGSDLYVERSPADSMRSFSGNEISVRSGGKWTQYFPADKVAWIRRNRELPRIFPVDPRDIASEGAHRGTIDVLEEDRIHSAELTADSGLPLIRVVTADANDNRTVYEFRQRNSFLPSSVQTHWPDGSLLQHVQVEYQDVLEGRAKMMSRCTRVFYPQGFTREPTPDGWRQKLSTQVVGDIILNRSIAADVFQVNFAPGTRVSDNTRLANYIVAAAPVPVRNPLWPYTAGIVAILLILIAIRQRSLQNNDRARTG